MFTSDIKDEQNEEQTSMKETRATLPAKVTIIISEPSESGVVIEPRNSDISFKPSDYNIDASMMQVP